MLKTFIVFLILTLRYYCNCSINGYIIGGGKADIIKFPFATYLAAETKTEAFICGSSVINQKVLLTAAHCVAGFITHPGQVMAFAGGDDLRVPKSIRKVHLVTIHEHFDSTKLINDIGLAKVSKKLTFGEFVKRTVIPKVFPMNIAFGMIAGWGVIDEKTGKTGVKLLHVEQKLQTEFICHFIVGTINKKVFCAGSFEADDPRPAGGDSGSAFIVKDFLQIGILSFRPHDNRAISVYTNVTSYYDWIAQQSKLLYCIKNKH